MTDARENLLRNLLEKIAAEQKYDNPDIKTSAIPSTGANFTSQLFTATIKSTEKEQLNVFAKVAVIDETMREEAGNLFDIEKYIYTKLFTAYKAMEDSHHVSEENRLVVPIFFGYSGDYMEEVLVLQDLAKDGFITHDRLNTIDWEYASTATEQLARLHALSLAHQKEYPEDYEEVCKLLQRKMFTEGGSMQEMLNRSFKLVPPMIREENRSKLQKFFESMGPKCYVDYIQPLKRPLITHGDFRQSNLMHKVDEDSKLQVVIVDYQTMYPGSVVTDLLYFIFTGSNGTFREKYYDQLIEHYYENLAAALRRLGLDPKEVFPRRDFDEELRRKLPFGLLTACMTVPLMTIDLTQVLEADGELFDTLNEMMSQAGNDLCAERLNEVVDDYVKWGVL